MSENSTILFVCEHGAVKSIIAATYLNKFAREKGLRIKALARGTNPDAGLSGYAVAGLLADGLAPSQLSPQKLSAEELELADKVIAFCDLREADPVRNNIEYWDSVPAVSEGYAQARDIIIAKLQAVMKDLI
jgi:arsenate reductase (thioredoxin)